MLKEQSDLLLQELIKLKIIKKTTDDWFHLSSPKIQNRSLIKNLKIKHHIDFYYKLSIGFSPDLSKYRIQMVDMVRSIVLNTYGEITHEQMTDLLSNEILAALKRAVNYKHYALLNKKLLMIKNDMKQSLLEEKLIELGINPECFPLKKKLST